MSDLVESLHAVLFVADAPATLTQLSVALGVTEGQTEQALEVLSERLNAAGPIQMAKLAGGYQLCTKSEYMPVVAEFLKPTRQRMTKSLLEVLAIVAYRQPITVAGIDAVRGVQSDHGVRTLVDRMLIQEVGRKQTPGRPVLYGTTKQFLHVFNLADLTQLPDLEIEKPQESPVFEV
jgi:segregation and condensation protein B